MKTLIRRLLRNAWVSRWIRWFGGSPQPRLLGVVALAAVAMGGVANSPSAGPDLLSRVGSWPGFTRGPAADVALAGHYAYVAMGEGGLAVLDVADPAKPVRVGGFLPAGLTDRVRVVGSRAYLATRVHRGGGCETEGWRGALVILDVSDPTHPTALGAYSTGSMIQGFYVDGVRVYLGDDIGAGMSGHMLSFRIVDVSNPARPVALYTDHTRTAYAVCADGERAYVSSWSEVQVWDVSRPASPTVVTNLPYDFPESIRGIHAAGQYVYVARGASGESGESDSGLLCIYAVSIPSAPWLKGSLVFNQAVLDIKTAGNYAFLAMAGAGLFALDVSDPGKPVQVGTCPTPGIALRVEVAGGHAFVAAYHGGLQVIDIRDPGHMNTVASFDTGLTTRRLRLAGDKAYLLGADKNPVSRTGLEARSRVEVLGLSDPARPVLLGTYDSARFVDSLDAAGGLVYLGWGHGGASGLQIIDFREPGRPVELSDTTNGPPTAEICGVRIDGHRAYITTTDGSLRILDVTDPIKPARLNPTTRIAMSGGAAWVEGNLVYLNSDAELEILDVANPQTPVVVGSGRCGSGYTGLWVAEAYAYLGLGWSGFRIVDARQPAKLVAVGEYNTVGEVNDLCVENHYAYIAEGWQGFEVFDVSQPALPVPIGGATTRGQARGVQVSGNYAYVAEGGSGLAILSLPPGPVTVVEDPTSHEAALGDTATLTVRAYGCGSLSYQWYCGESGDVSHPVAGTNGASLTTPVLTEASAYWVRVSNGTASGDSRTAWIHPVAPVALELISLWPGWRRGPALDVQAAGSVACIAAGDAGLMIYDLADPSAPRRLGSFDTKASASGLAQSGQLAFVACGDKGLRVVDLSQASAPVEIGSIALDGYANKVVVGGAYAYLLGDQLRIIDIRDPAHPRAVGSYKVKGNNLKVLGQYAFVVGGGYDSLAGGERGFLQVVDLTNPADPQLLGVYVTPTIARGVAVVGHYAYLAIGSTRDFTGAQIHGGLQVIDVSNPTQPRWVSTIPYSGSTAGVFISEPYAYAAFSESGFQIIDVSHPAAPKPLGALGAIQTANAVVTSGSRVYVASGDSGLQVIDVAAPASAKRLGGVATGGYSEDVAVSGQQAFLADAGGGLKIMDVGDVTRPSLAGVHRANARRVAAAGPLVYLAADTLQVLGVSNPAQPNLLANLKEWADDIFLSGDYAYLSGQELRTVDVRDPATPKMVGGVRLWDLGKTPRGMAFMGPYACLGQEWDGMQVLDLGLPNQPRQVGSYYTDAPVWDVAVRGDVACVTLGSELPALEVLDLRDLQRPTRTARVPLPLANNVAFMGSYACVTGEGLQVFDLGDPDRPVRVGSHQLGSPTHGLQVVGNLVYVAAGDYGLAIYRLTPQLRLNPPVLDSHGLSLSWLGAPGVRLQQTTSLGDPDWRDVPQSEGTNRLQLSTTPRAAFFRLARP